MGKRLWAKAPTIASGADRWPPAEAPGSGMLAAAPALAGENPMQELADGIGQKS